ncbi:hypothetical protein [Aneurinibacillus terranovensis]|uniref:hypothetical protein n=1 Tax=Aneurinibacillus terranovensis TaxID=278991 RepID=UPI0012DFCDBF|nr:hypothetical protein [Aneurinibacillus terranovensis]
MRIGKLYILSRTLRKTRGRCRSSFFCRVAKRPLSDRKVGPTKHPGNQTNTLNA